MGPTNVALVKLYEADQQLRRARERLEAATRNVRVQERRVHDLQERLALAGGKLREQQAHSGALDVDLKSREARIDRLRTQQQTANTAREYQTFLVEINTEKVDRGKVEDELLRAMQAVEELKKESADLGAQVQAEQSKLAAMRGEIEGKARQLKEEIDALVPKRMAAAEAVPGSVRDAFERLTERYDGEAMASMGKPHPKREEYVCNACNMSLVVDIYNRLHTRNEIVFCPSCRRILYIPDDLPVETAVQKPKERKEPRAKRERKPKDEGLGAAVTRQTMAADVLRSMRAEEESAPQDAPASGPDASPDQVAPPQAPAPQAGEGTPPG